MADAPEARLYTRAAFEQQRARVRAVQKRDGWVLALSSLILSVGLILLLLWLEPRVSRLVHVTAAIVGCLLVLLTLGVMTLRTRTHVRAIRPNCPHCGIELDAIAERIAAETGECDACGERIIE